MSTIPASPSPKENENDEPINLLRGWPNPTLLPTNALTHAANAVLTDPTISTPALLYGDDEGYEPLRASIATWLTAFYRPETSAPVTAERITITGGASQNLGAMLAVYTDPAYTRAIWCVAPTYYLAFRVFEDAGFGATPGRIRAVPEDADGSQGGVDLAFLRREMRACEEAWRGAQTPLYKLQRGRERAKVYRHIIYCVPTFSNPSSRTMSVECRRELVRVAREFEALVVCDDVYDFLLWDARARASNPDERSMPTVAKVGESEMAAAHLPRVVDVDRELDGGAERAGADGFGNVCSNGTFSKIAGPGMRVGWVEGTEKFAYGVSQAGTTCSGGAPSQLSSTFIHHLLTTSALNTHITHTLIPSLRHRSHILLSAIETHLLPLGFTIAQQEQPPDSAMANVKGGYFAWLLLPPALKADAKVLARRCLGEEAVVVGGGNLFEVPFIAGGGGGGGERIGFGRWVRLCWAWEGEERLAEGVERVARVVARMLKEQEEGVVAVDGGEGVGVEGFK